MQTRVVLHGKNSMEILNGLNRNFENFNVSIAQWGNGAECVFEDCEEARRAVNKTVREYVVDVLEPSEIKRIIKKATCK